MQTFLQMQTEMTSRLGVATNSTKFPLARIKLLLQDAHLWATALYPFRELTLETDVLASTGVTSTYIAGAKDFTYPATYRSNSIWMIFIGSNEYLKRNFDDLLRYVLNNSTSNKRRYADLGRNYIVYPSPSTGTLKVYGQKQATQISADGDTTIFSSANDEGNEAILNKAISVAKNDKSKEQDAVMTLTKLFSDQKDKAQFDKPMAKPIFDVPDFFGGGRNTLINQNWQQSDDNNDEDF
jgi:hypothetical protein